MFRLTRGQRQYPATREPAILHGGRQIEAVLRGSTESQNIGDRLMWNVAGALLREMRISTTYRFAHWDRRFDAVPDPRKIRALFDLGNVYYCDSWPQRVGDRIQRSIKFNLAFRHAKIVFLPCGWGPYRREDWPRLRQLTRDAILFARDRISLEYLTEARGAEGTAFCPDLALMCQQQEPHTGADLLNELGLSKSDRLLGLIPNVRCIEDGVTPLADSTFYHRHLERVVQWSRANGYQAVGISHSVKTDRDRKLLVGLGIPIVESDDPLIIRSVIANLSMAVCSRYHGLVNGLVHNVPVVSLGWQHKYLGLMQYFELSEFDHPLEESSGELADRLSALAASHERLSIQIDEKLGQARAEISEGMSALSRRLSGPASVLTAPIRFENAGIETVSHVRASPGTRLVRGIRRMVAA